MIQVLLVHNKFRWNKPLTYLSYAIRVFTASKWNHCAIRIGDRVIESKGNGVTIQPYTTWVNYSDRIVKVMTPRSDIQLNLEEVLFTEGEPYGFLDLLQIARRIKAERWDGIDKIYLKDKKGLMCSDLVCILLGVPKNYTPADFDSLRMFYSLLEDGEEYHTTRD